MRLGTGEFFAQQLKRMDLELDAVDRPEVAAGTVCRLSARCSVFMKSDCTHKLNKGEANKNDIVLSLSNVMARKVLEFLAKARIEKGRVLVVGGATRNPHMLRFVREGLPAGGLRRPRAGALHRGLRRGVPGEREGAALPELASLRQRRGHRIRPRQAALRGAGQGRLRPLAPGQAAGRARLRPRYRRRLDDHQGRAHRHGDEGDRRQPLRAHLGDPVASLKRCLEEVRGQIEAGARRGRPPAHPPRRHHRLRAASCWRLLRDPGIYNEIIAHTVGTTFFDRDIDTIFEIGGQDAKYVYLRNRVPVDYAMNEACSAGTGSFLEESAAGDLDIRRAEEIGPITNEGDLAAALRRALLGLHQLRHPQGHPAGRDPRGPGRRPRAVDRRQTTSTASSATGASATTSCCRAASPKNPAVAYAFASLLEKKIHRAAAPGADGCFGVGLLALEKLASGEVAARRTTRSTT